MKLFRMKWILYDSVFILMLFLLWLLIESRISSNTIDAGLLAKSLIYSFVTFLGLQFRAIKSNNDHFAANTESWYHLLAFPLCVFIYLILDFALYNLPDNIFLMNIVWFGVFGLTFSISLYVIHSNITRRKSCTETKSNLNRQFEH